MSLSLSLYPLPAPSHPPPLVSPAFLSPKSTMDVRREEDKACLKTGTEFVTYVTTLQLHANCHAGARMCICSAEGVCIKTLTGQTPSSSPGETLYSISYIPLNYNGPTQNVCPVPPLQTTRPKTTLSCRVVHIAPQGAFTRIHIQRP
jgi:hypothetical protein